jgi:hypothetical protein
VSVHPGTVQTSIVLLDGWLSKAQQAFSPYFLRAPRIAANVVLQAAMSQPDPEEIITKLEDINVKYPADKWLHYANGQGVVCPRSCLKFKSHERNDAVARALWKVSEEALTAILARPPPKKKVAVVTPPVVQEKVKKEMKEEFEEGTNQPEVVEKEEEEEVVVEKSNELGFVINENGEVIFDDEEEVEMKIEIQPNSSESETGETSGFETEPFSSETDLD